VKRVPKDKIIFCGKLLEWVATKNEKNKIDLFDLQSKKKGWKGHLQGRRSWAPWILRLEL
jgi:hypothetical protein